MADQDKRLYLDANATTPPLPEVVEAVAACLRHNWGNPSSQHTEGRRAKHAIQVAREAAASLLGVPAGWITWTSGATESINLWIRGRIAAYRDDGPTPALVVSTAEHPAVLRSAEAVAREGLARLVRLKTDAMGRVDAELLARTLDDLEDPIAGVALIAAHNETGAAQDVAALSAVCAARDVPLLLDGVQWTGKLPASVADWGAAAWAVSFHKFGGPKGVGLLAAAPGTIEEPLLHGGPQERRRRGGTENVPGIVGAGRAAELAAVELETRSTRWQQLLSEIRGGLPRVWPGADPLWDEQPRLPQTMLVRFPGWRGVELAQRLDLEGIAVGTGSACSSGAVTVSDSLVAMGRNEQEAAELIRISLTPDVAPDAAERLLAVLAQIHQGVSA